MRDYPARKGIAFANIPLFGHKDKDLLVRSLELSDGIQMALTHLVEEDPYGIYVEAYQQVRDDFSDYIILDNSIMEIGKAVSPERLVAAAEKVGAHEIILPDVFRKAEESFEATVTAAKQMFDVPYKLMGVAQGSTIEEFVWCFRMLMLQEEIDVIGIPKVASTLPFMSDRDSRNPILNKLLADNLLYSATKIYGKEIHLLGAWTVNDMKIQNRFKKYIRSLDSVLPNWEAEHGRDWNLKSATRGDRTPGTARHATQFIPPAFDKYERGNINVAKGWLEWNTEID